jgi:hypothetical protein
MTAVKLNERQNLTELNDVWCSWSGGGRLPSPVTWSHLGLSEVVMKGQNSCIEVNDHGRSKLCTHRYRICKH